MDPVLTYLLKMGIPAEAATQIAAKFNPPRTVPPLAALQAGRPAPYQSDVAADGRASLQRQSGKAITDQEMSDWNQNAPARAHSDGLEGAVGGIASGGGEDPVQKLLVEKYGMDPAKAASLAKRVTSGHPLAQEADEDRQRKARLADQTSRQHLQEVAEDQLGQMGTMESNAKKFTHMHDVYNNNRADYGKTWSFEPGDEQWYRNVVGMHREKLQRAADAAYAADQAAVGNVAEGEMQRMQNFQDYSNSFSGGQTPWELYPSGNLVPKR